MEVILLKRSIPKATTQHVTIGWSYQLVGGGGYFRNFWVGMCSWDPGILNLYPELVQLNFATLY